MDALDIPTIQRLHSNQRNKNKFMDNYLLEISQRLKTQDNRITQNPMFCVQEKRRDVGYDSNYANRLCWHNAESGETIYDDENDFKEAPEGDEWDEFGYVDRWETVMVAFTEEGCKEYLRQNGHNLRQPRIYVESFNRCPEMIAIRKMLMELKPENQILATES
jgi:hypothetical protein